MKPPSLFKPRQLLVAGLGACAMLAHAMPGSGSQARPMAQMAEPLACVVLDAGAAARLKLSADQLAEWQRLQQEHDQLFDGRCRSTARLAEAAEAADAPAKSGPLPDHHTRAMQVYRRDFLVFLTSLSSEQRALLVDAASLREAGNGPGNDRARLEEKLIRHRLML